MSQLKSRIGDLNDNCFSLTTELVVELCRAFEEEIGDKPTIAELCELLYWGIRSSAPDILKDINVENLAELTPKVARRIKVRPNRGDVIAIPASKDSVFLVLYLGKFGRFGHAFGILKGRHKRKPPAAQWQAQVVARPFFSGLEGVSSGRWSIIAHRPDWLALFPHEPEYYHSKRDFPDDDSIGPYGSAETASNYKGKRDRRDVVEYSSNGESFVLRHLSKREAQEIGLLEISFFQCGLEEQVEAYLKKLLR
jgi:hypothetical protein